LFSLANTLLQRMLSNPFAALSEMNILGILVAALLFGTAMALTIAQDSPLPRILADITQSLYRLAGWVLKALPIGLFAITYQLSAQINLDTVAALVQFSAVVLGATLVHGLIVLPAIAWWVAGIPPWRFLNLIVQPLVTALATSSSAATLPLSMATAEKELKVSRARSAFVLPLGATANMDGTALFEGIAAVFLAYMFGVELGYCGHHCDLCCRHAVVCRRSGHALWVDGWHATGAYCRWYTAGSHWSPAANRTTTRYF
jgi:Na+/H+-dicarboxylate symporter